MKRILALGLAVIMLFALCACSGNGDNTKGDVSYDIPEGKAIPDDAVLDIMVTSHPSWPYQENWKVWQYIKESVGGKINVVAIPESEFSTKFTLVMTAPEQMPDIFAVGEKPGNFEDYCEQGAFLPFDDYEEFLPDYKKFWANVPENEMWMYNTRKDSDGKVYFSPIYGLERSTNIRGWLYRKDILDKHGLKTPETIDDLYTVSKKLKELYPDSYPFCIRTAQRNFDVIGASWEEYFNHGVYYDFATETWKYGAREETMYDIVEFFKKMVEEKLAPSDCFTINTSSWQELVATDRGFIFPEYQVRIDFFNSLARQANPEFTIAAMVPPKTEGGVAKVNKYNYPPQGLIVANTNDKARIANAFRYVNWFYTDEACELVSWGKEGETYEVVNGERKFIVDGAGQTAQSLYGINTRGTNMRFDPDAIGATISKEQYEVTDFLLEHTVDELNPLLWMSLSTEQSKELADLTVSIQTVVSENLNKFVIGQRPLSEWDQFQTELSELPIDEVLAIYEEAYNKVK